MQGFTPVPNLTLVQALHEGNLRRKAIASNSFFNSMLLEKGPNGAFKDVPKELRSQWEKFRSPPGIDAFREHLKSLDIQGCQDAESAEKIGRMKDGEAFYLRLAETRPEDEGPVERDFFIKMEEGKLKLFRVSEDVDFSPFHTGTLALVAQKDKAFGPSISKEFMHNGRKKTLTCRFDKEQATLVNTMLKCDHGFAPDAKTPLIQLLDKHDKPIIDLAEALFGYNEIFLKLGGKIGSVKIGSREGGLFEAFEGENTHSWITDGSAIAFLARGYWGFFDCFNELEVPNPDAKGGLDYIEISDANRRIVRVTDSLDLKRGVLFLKADENQK